MANIFLTKKCNLNCSYCFADEFVNKNIDEISFDDFEYALNFIKTDKNERVGLIGGEPTLHSMFPQILEKLINDDEIKNVILYTNGLEIDKYIDLLVSDKISLLINCNSEKDIGINNFDKLKQNLILLKNKKTKNYTLGINLYSTALDYSYIFDLLNYSPKKEIRFSTALPNQYKEKTSKVLEEFEYFKPFLFRFFKECIDRGFVPVNDCNSIPSCILSSEEIRILLKLNQLGKKYNIYGPISSAQVCLPVIDILPDLLAVRCFGMSNSLKISIKEFDSIVNLRKYFFNKIDIYARVSHISEKCENCKVGFLEKCGVCFTYKLKKINKIKEKLSLKDS